MFEKGIKGCVMRVQISVYIFAGNKKEACLRTDPD
jgi:hypothetical protein